MVVKKRKKSPQKLLSPSPEWNKSGAKQVQPLETHIEI